MATTILHKQTRVGTAGEEVPRAALGDDGPATVPRLTTERVVPLRSLRDPAAARARVPVGQEVSTR